MLYNKMNLIRFLITLSLIVVAFYKPLYAKLDGALDNKTYTQFVYLGVLAVVLLVSCLVLPQENFFFEVTPHRILGRNLPRQAIFDGKPITFSFNSVGSGMCTDNGCNSYGMIKGCPNARGYGIGSTDDSIL
jgi:hypothetical protein